ncbi:MAG: hypothetical protein ACE5FA_06425 [Dehalococcoidia bacterium]
MTLPETPASPTHPVSLARVELVLDSFRVVGNIRQPGVPRRLVDLLNNTDIEFLELEDVRIDDPCAQRSRPRTFRNLEVNRTSVLFAMPRGGDSPDHGDAFDTVKKVPVSSTIVLPGFEVTGNVHFIPSVDPRKVPMLINKHFIPVTQATVTGADGRTASWTEPVCVVNLERAVLYGVRDED